MTTIKLNKKPSDAPAVVAKKSPVRRSSVVSRDRTTAAVKAQRTETQQSHTQASKPVRAEREHRPSAPENNGAPRQRNHRHDGALHEQSSTPARQQTPDSRAPASRAVQVDARRNSTTSRDKADREGAY
ncbi:MAG: pseudouridine synthase, partial [Methylotenera sp.]